MRPMLYHALLRGFVQAIRLSNIESRRNSRIMTLFGRGILGLERAWKAKPLERQLRHRERVVRSTLTMH
jgi:hypothetical protein